MDKYFFNDGITELKKFFNTFKPSAEQLEAWYDRLKFFSDEAWKRAIFKLSEQATNPNYATIKASLFDATKEIKNENPKTYEAKYENFAEASDQKWEFQKECFKQLRLLMENNGSVEQYEELKALWLSGYKNLPNYKTAEEWKQEASQLIDPTTTRY